MARQIGATAGSGPVVAERKNIDASATLTSGLNIWSAITLLNGIAQGTAVGQRIGRKTVLKSLLVRWQISTWQGVTRILVVYDHNPNGALPLIADILTNPGVLGINAPNNLGNSDRFLILKDFYPGKDFSLTMGATASIGDSFFIKLPDGGLQNQWTDATTGTIADVTTGAIYIMSVSISAASPVIFTSRIRYTDV